MLYIKRLDRLEIWDKKPKSKVGKRERVPRRWCEGEASHISISHVSRVPHKHTYIHACMHCCCEETQPIAREKPKDCAISVVLQKKNAQRDNKVEETSSVPCWFLPLSRLELRPLTLDFKSNMLRWRVVLFRSNGPRWCMWSSSSSHGWSMG